MKKTKKTWSFDIFIFSAWTVKDQLKDKNIKLTGKELKSFLSYLDESLYESLDEKISDLQAESYDILEDALNDIKKELKKPKNERDILSYF